MADAVTTLLQALAGQVRPGNFDLFNPASAEAKFHRRTVADFPCAALVKLTDALREDPQFGPYDAGFYMAEPLQGAELSLQSIARHLLARVQYESPSEAVESLRALFKANQSTLIEVTVLWGFATRETLDLGEFKLMPVADLPPSCEKDQVTGVPTFLSTAHDLNDICSARPKIALVRRLECSPLFWKASEKGGHKWPPAPSDVLKPGWPTYPTPFEIASVLALSAAGLTPVGRWLQRECTVPGTRDSWWIDLPEVRSAFQTPPDLQPIPTTMAPDVQRYLALDAKSRSSLRVAIDRIARGGLLLRERRGQDTPMRLTDCALNFGIAAESLLKGNEDDQSNLSYKVRTRGTALLGGDAKARKATYDLLKQLYQLRSKAAHGDFVYVRPGGKPTSAELRRTQLVWDTLGKAERTCVALVREILVRGGVPSNWDGIVCGF